MDRHPWPCLYRVVFTEPARTVIPHPGHAWHSDLDVAMAHVTNLRKRGISGRIEGPFPEPESTQRLIRHYEATR